MSADEFTIIWREDKMRRNYCEEKTTQAACYLLRAHEGSMSYMKLIKLLYLADRSALLRYGRPITYDNYYSLDRGPILSRTLGLITEGPMNGVGDYWDRFISKPMGYKVFISGNDCPLDDLSEAECEILHRVYSKLGHMNKWHLVDYLHANLPEWEDPHGSSLPITWDDIFFEIGPQMIDDKSQEQLLEKLNKWLLELNQIIKEYSDVERINHIDFSEDSFHTIILQFRSLGLITQGDKPRSLKDTSIYWKLTPYGNSYITKLRAIKREEKA